MKYEALPGIEEALRKVMEAKKESEKESEKGEKEEKDEKAGEDQEDKYPKKSGKKSKDYDGDGTVEDETDEYAGVKDRAIKKAMKKEEVELDEKAPPGAKYERMVKHIKAGYSKDGELTKKEKGIAYATAWKAKNKAVKEEAEKEAKHEDEKEDKALIKKEVKKALKNEEKDPCWKGYKQIGMKDKGGRKVPNCVPANEELEAIENELFESGLFSDDEVRYIVGQKWEELEEATAMAKRGLDEPAIRQKIASKTGGGEAADRASKLEKQPTYGDANKAKQRQNLARAQRGDFRKTTSSSPGLHGYAHKSNDPAVKAKQAARGAQRGALTPNEKKDLGR